MGVPRVYLDTGMPVKRYVKEEGGEIADTYFRRALRGEAALYIYGINLGRWLAPGSW